jgi:hypothetical protein
MGLFQTFKSFNRSDQAVQLDSSWFNVQWFNGRQTELDWNFTFEDSRSVEGQDRLEVQLATSSLMWIPSRVLKKTHMLRCGLIASRASHLDLFEQPARGFFSELLAFRRTLSGFDCCLGHLQRDAVWQ